MKKNLLAIGLLAIVGSVQAQTVLLHVDDTAKMYVSEGTLVYNGGGMQSKGSGVIDLHGNMMVVGNNSTDVLRTLPTIVTPNPTNVIIRLNNTLTPVTSTYGQLFITGIPQSGLTSSVVDKEYAATKHGTYQQIGMPFIGKTFATLSTEMGGGFTESRWSNREVLKWSNTNLRWDGSTVPTVPITSATQPGITISLTAPTVAADRTAYYTVGTGSGMNPELLHTLRGTPFADGLTAAGRVDLTPGNVTFGNLGNNTNIYYEKYNTYIFDTFDNTTPWGTATTFGKYTYQLSNPFLTNIDLSMIGFTELGSTTDNNALSNIWGIAVNPTSVAYSSATGTSSSYAAGQNVTFDAFSKPTGNYSALLIKPLGTFKIKLRDNTAQKLDFDNLRRFKSVPRVEDVNNPYSVTAAKNASAIKQLGVLALDANGNQIGETYYVVAPHFASGNIIDPSISSVQAMTNTSALIQTFEETPAGGIDQNYASTYRLYINEANEVNYLGKRIDLNIFGSNVASLKFEIRDNTQLVANGTHILSAGTGFYYKIGNGQAIQVNQGDTVPVNSTNYGLYYGAPQSVLSNNEVKPTSRTLVTYNPDISNYIVRFDPEWKSATVEVFDASGKLIISEKSIKTTSDFVIRLDSAIKAGYVVRVIGNDGTIVNTKILIK